MMLYAVSGTAGIGILRAGSLLSIDEFDESFDKRDSLSPDGSLSACCNFKSIDELEESCERRFDMSLNRFSGVGLF